MKKYKVRVHDVTAFGAMAQPYKDYLLQSEESLGAFAERLSAKGFMDEAKHRWIMPGAIIWIEQG
jgi:hypothetical protein